MRHLFCVCLIFCLSATLLAQSSSYEIRPDDKLQFSYWENPNLNTTATVGKDGGIELPIIGRIAAAGLTIKQLRDKIVSQMALYNRVITQLSIVVLDYGSNTVYVTGQVRAPGRYSFEEIPNLWDIILQAGGHLETAFLDQVTVVRKEGNGEVFVVDLSKALRQGQLNTLPKIYPGDTIDVPGTTVAGTTPSPLSQKSEIYILGAVGVPGSHKFESGLNIVEAIGRAGGPISTANLEKVRFVTMDASGKSRTQVFNLKSYFEQSRHHPLNVKAGDTIFVPWDKGMSPILRAAFTAFVTTGITTTIVLLLR